MLAHTRQITSDGLSYVSQSLVPRPALAVTTRKSRAASCFPTVLIGLEHHQQFQVFTAIVCGPDGYLLWAGWNGLIGRNPNSQESIGLYRR